MGISSCSLILKLDNFAAQALKKVGKKISYNGIPREIAGSLGSDLANMGKYGKRAILSTLDNDLYKQAGKNTSSALQALKKGADVLQCAANPSAFPEVLAQNTLEDGLKAIANNTFSTKSLAQVCIDDIFRFPASYLDAYPAAKQAVENYAKTHHGALNITGTVLKNLIG